ncbi:MAG TPA: hypothetical protein ENK54_09185 [Thiotrichales bacterium]|nr:hypothetical protein [Thiotrichales bacterium]
MNERSVENDIPRLQKIISVLWPSFLTAGAATVATFALIDPVEVAHCSGWEKVPSRLGAYTLGFFLFWSLTSLSSALTCYFRRPCHAPATAARDR